MRVSPAVVSEATCSSCWSLGTEPYCHSEPLRELWAMALPLRLWELADTTYIKIKILSEFSEGSFYLKHLKKQNKTKKTLEHIFLASLMLRSWHRRTPTIRICLNKNFERTLKKISEPHLDQHIVSHINGCSVGMRSGENHFYVAISSPTQVISRSFTLLQNRKTDVRSVLLLSSASS